MTDTAIEIDQYLAQPPAKVWHGGWRSHVLAALERLLAGANRRS